MFVVLIAALFGFILAAPAPAPIPEPKADPKADYIVPITYSTFGNIKDLISRTIPLNFFN